MNAHMSAHYTTARLPPLGLQFAARATLIGQRAAELASKAVVSLRKHISVISFLKKQTPHKSTRRSISDTLAVALTQVCAVGQDFDGPDAHRELERLVREYIVLEQLARVPPSTRDSTHYSESRLPKLVHPPAPPALRLPVRLRSRSSSVGSSSCDSEVRNVWPCDQILLLWSYYNVLLSLSLR